MGTFSITLDIMSPDRRTSRPVELLVDTGATFTWLPEQVLRELGYAADSEESFQLGDGRIIAAPVCDVLVRIDGKVRTTPCAFATNGQGGVLGAITLEAFLLAPDPVNKKLVPVVGLAMTSTMEQAA